MLTLSLLTLLACGSLEAPAPVAAPVDATPVEAPASAPAGGTMTVEVFDVGQGDAILIRTPGGKRVLIDAGTGNTGEAALPLLQARGVDRLDLVVGTHPHSDHVGGLDEVLDLLPTKLYVDNGLPHTTDTYERLMAVVERKKIAYKPAKAGQTYKLDSGVVFTVLSPTEHPIRESRSELNANSVVMRATYGRACFLFVGDAESETEEQLLENKVQPCDMLKVAHHGSAYASSAAFLAAVQPKAAFVSVAASNEYGHPSPEALQRLEAAGAKVFRTDQLGTLKIETDGQKATVIPERGRSWAVPLDGATGATVETPAIETQSNAKLDLNKATAAQLEALPGIGATLAAEIVSYRKAKGRFRTVDDLDKVPGIGPATLEQLRPLVRVGE